MRTYYSNEKNAQIIIALLKAHGIRKVIASPGTTNMALVVSMQNDPYFQMISSVDERSAAYLACGLAAESNEPVVISCTGATASRNYIPGLTEAYYRKLPVIAITSTQNVSKVGHLIAQVIDRSTIQNDIAKLSVTLPIVNNDDEFWECEVKVNQAILETHRNGGGPVHINLPTVYSRTYNIKQLPKVRAIKRISPSQTKFPKLPLGKIAIFIGAHKEFTPKETALIEGFCEKNNAIVLVDHTSAYKGNYRVLFSLFASQSSSEYISQFSPDLLIHLGEITGDYSIYKIACREVWRVSEDGEIKDPFRKLQYIFEMPEHSFFEYYNNNRNEAHNTYFNLCQFKTNTLRKELSQINLPFSNIWVASKIASEIPSNSTIHFGILNSLRSWNFFELESTVNSSCNVGGFGIDGSLSTIVGASLNNKNKLFYCVIGDLAFFYDMNVLGNKHIGENLRILVINNGKGTEFRQFNHTAALLGDDADKFVAAAGHFKGKSNSLIKNYAYALGFEYLCAKNKKEFEQIYQRFITDIPTKSSIIFEVFTESTNESDALKLVVSIKKSKKNNLKKLAKQIIGLENSHKIRKFIDKIKQPTTGK